jgi:trehalose 6-phosphate synthase/phosphatase
MTSPSTNVSTHRSTTGRVRELRPASSGPRLLGVDRLDYTKGIPQRLSAFERLLTFEPGLIGKVHFLQIAVPSREDAAGYSDLRTNVEQIAGRINAAFGSTHWKPLEIVFDNLSPEELIALYRAADVMIVTPPRGGMNLVAKEFVASRVDNDGVLVLSRGAGAACELTASVMVDGDDESSILWGIRTALRMSAADRRTRMRRLRARVTANPVGWWMTRSLIPLGDCGDNACTAE